MNNTGSSQRNLTADSLKGLAVIFMISIHVTKLFSLHEVSDGWFGQLAFFLGGPLCAPVFLGIMGYFIARSKKTLNAEIKRGLLLFAGGMALNIGLNLNLIISSLSGRIPIHVSLYQYVFGVDILHSAGLAVIILAIIKRINTGIIPLLILIVSLYPLDILLSGYIRPSQTWLQIITAFFWGNYEHSYFSLIPWLAFPLCGFVYSRLNGRIHQHLAGKPAKTVSITAAAALIVFTLNYAVGTTHNLPLYYNHDVLFFGWMLVFLTGYISLSDLFVQRFNKNIAVKYIAWLGENVTLIYVLQWLMIGNLATELYGSRGLTAVLVWILLIIAAASVMAYIIKNISLRKISSAVISYFAS